MFSHQSRTVCFSLWTFAVARIKKRISLAFTSFNSYASGIGLEELTWYVDKSVSDGGAK